MLPTETRVRLGKLVLNVSTILSMAEWVCFNFMTAMSENNQLLETMEPEERPAKMRKLEHAESVGDTTAPDVAPAKATSDQQTAMTTQTGEANNTDVKPTTTEQNDGDDAAPTISKNQLKKQRRHERWESGREDRKAKRKEKIKEKKERRRELYAQATPDEDGNRPKPPPTRPPKHSAGLGKQLPVTVIFDCDFEELMYDHELKSLGLQITRCYSDNRKAKFRTHLALASFGGKMKERFDGILAKQYTSWKGFQFFEDDFVAVAEKSKEWMRGPKGGEVDGALESGKDDQAAEGESSEEAAGAAAASSSSSSEEGEIVYLSSESDNVLTHLKPNSTYIIGGLVDKNRHKGICHKRAVARGIKTAKLPIGQYLEMKSRQVLVTNHVLEIMLKWLEFGDWGKAFMEVMPKRKGGRLKGEGGDEEESHAAGDEGDERDEGVGGMGDEQLADEAEETGQGEDKMAC